LPGRPAVKKTEEEEGIGLCLTSIMKQIMKYQYAIENGRTSLKEVWVCADCRKDHTDMILVGKWRLIDKSIDPKLNCTKGCFQAGDEERDEGGGGTVMRFPLLLL